jgi:SAM-dependent methyltransferase
MNLKTSVWRVQRKVIGANIGRLFFYQSRIDSSENPTPLRTLGRLNQWITEKGITAPWMMTQAECHRLWAGQNNKTSAAGNRPVDYAVKSQEIVKFLHKFWKDSVGKEDAICELGCNAGANLNGLFNLGYRHLGGIEINPDALAQLRASFPQLAQTASLQQSSIEDALHRMPDDSVDVLFSMAVLIHVHPKSNFILKDMVRVARKYIAVIELESANCAYVFSRNYKRVFEHLGCREVASCLIDKHSIQPDADSYYGYVARLFEVPK